MNDFLRDLQKLQEDGYFQKKNREALERLRQSSQKLEVRPSPITGEPMTQEVFCGVVIDRCPKSGGIWLDAGELEEILDFVQKEDTTTSTLSQFFEGLFGGKSSDK